MLKRFLVCNNITNKPFTCTKWGGIKTCDVPIIHECTINQPSRIRTDVYKLNNNTWNTIEWDADNGYIDEKNLKMNNNLHSYVEQTCLFPGMAGSGKSKYYKKHREP